MTSSISTNLNQSPYWDDFSANSQYYRVLYKPGPAVQTRELNTLQSMILNQINSFGDNIFVGGTIIKGCNITKDSSVGYVKLVDTFANGAALTTSTLSGTTAISSNSGLTAYVKLTQQGYIATSPNLNTIFVKYLNSGVTNSAIKTFQPNETVNFYNSANVLIAQVNVANDAVSGGANTTTGFSYVAGVDSGIIYQKGMFLDVEKQSLIVTPYSNQPNGVSIGFSSLESIVTAYQDPNLNDNSQGSPNYQAPGADRLQIVPTLVVVPTNSNSTNNFFSIVDFVNGSPSYVNQDTQYAEIGKKMAQISDDTNGSFVIKNFPVNTTQLFFANGVIDPNNIALTVGAGLGYINGNRINLIGTLQTSLPKGETIGYANSEIITAQMGNYISVKDVAGNFDPTIVQTVYLCSANAYAVSNSVSMGIAPNAMTNPGSVIGTASLIGMQYLSGNLNTKTASYNMFLTNVQMTGTNQFTSVCSLYANTGSTKAFADIIQANSSTYSILQSPVSSPLVYSLGSSAVDTLKNSSNATVTQFQYVQSTSVSFNTSGSATVVIPTHVGGQDQLTYGVGNIPSSLAPQFKIVCESNAISANIAGSISNTSTTALLGSGTSFSTTLYPGALIVIANSTASEIKQVNNIVDATHLNLVQPLTSSWSGANVAIEYLAGTLLPLTTAPNMVINVSNSTSFNVSLGTGLNTTMSANISYNTQRVNAIPRKKDLQTDVWVKIDCSTHAANTVGPWCLGIPDVYTIKNVYICGTSFSTASPTSNNWTLLNGQNDAYYGLSYLYNNGMSLNSSGSNSKLLIQLECFLPDVSQGIGFYSVDSYPVDDTGVTANSIFTRDIPNYISTTASTTYNLRNSVDFRFYTANTIPLINNTAAIACTSITNPSNTQTFSVSNLYLPTVYSQFETSFQYYMGRYDIVGLSNTGSLIISTGIPSVNPQPSGTIQSGMSIASIYIPPYPSLTPEIVDLVMANGYPTTSISYNTNRRYTMSDIGQLDARITQVEYYTSLSLLEQSTQNLQLTNSNGTNRFQNGMLADPMDNFSIANTNDPSFNIAIDSNASVARPVFNQFLNNLVFNASNSQNVTLSNDGRIVSLNYTPQTFISQQFASQERNCAQDTTYVWSGAIVISPTGDYYPDVTIGATVVANQDLYSNFVNLVNAWNTQYGTWTETGSSTSSTLTNKQDDYITLDAASPDGAGWVTTNTYDNITSTTYTKQQLAVSETSSTVDLGSYITSVSILPYCRANILQFHSYGLKPNTQVWVFVNNILMTPTYTVQSNGAGGAITSVINLTTDSTGSIWGYLWIPANTFHTGTLTVEIMDISNLVTQSNIITTQASCSYYGTNISYTENDITLQTESAQFSTYTVSNTVVTSSTSTAQGYQVDPIGQTFSVLSTQLPSGVQGIYVTSLDLFFAAKDPNYGISIHIEPLENGYPTGEIVQSSLVHYVPSQVNTSSDSSIATNIQFPAPVFLEVGNYAFIVIPDGSNPNYDIWTGVIGATDVKSNTPIYGLSASGAMLMSSQAVTWTVYQNESIKYNLYYANFTANSGSAMFNNDNSEFCNISGNFGNYTLGDTVYFGNAANNFTGANVQSTSNTVYVANTYGIVNGSVLAISSNTNANSFITNVSSVVNSTAFVVSKTPPFTDNLTSGVYLVGNLPNGVVRSGSNSSFLIVTNSTATTGNYLNKSNNYIAFDANSGAFSYVNCITDVIYETIMPKFSTSVPSVCNINLIMQGTSNTYVIDTNSTSLTYGTDTDFYDYPRVVMSRSNECAFLAGAKSLSVNGVMQTTSSTISPVFNMGKAGTVLIHNIVNAEQTGNTVFWSEVNNVGNSVNKYISTTVSLTSGLYAEDMILYLGVYYPANTEIYVYAKLQNQYDPDNFYLKSWTPMYSTNTYRSSKINTNDISEYTFRFSNTAPTSNSGPYTAYIDSTNNNVVTYTTPSGSTYRTYNMFAIKIVLCADASMVVPQITDMRCIAVS